MGYQQELSSFSSVALFVEVSIIIPSSIQCFFAYTNIRSQARYLEMKEKEGDTGNAPTKTKAALMGDLALTLCRALGRYQPVSLRYRSIQYSTQELSLFARCSLWNQYSGSY